MRGVHMLKKCMLPVLTLALMLVMAITAFAEGWAQEGSDWVYYDANNNKVRNEWRKGADDKWRYLGQNGAMLTSTIVDYQYYVDSEGIMAANVSNVSFRIDSDLKAQADTLFAALGLNMTTAFNIFLRQSVRQGCIPFDITLDVPNAETVAALLEARQMMADPDTEKYSVEDALKELKA